MTKIHLNVARSSVSLASTLQLLIDKYKDSSKLMLILRGSSMSYMEDHVLSYKAPLYGRCTAQMKNTAIATGASRMAEISTKVGESTSVCATYLKNLIALGLVQKETSYGEKESRKSIYSIDDNMFRFWYRFVPENYSIISRGAADLAYRRIEPHLSDYMGKVFEEICTQYLWNLLLAGKSPVEFREPGRWWGTNPATRKQTEIDIMGEQDKNTVLFGECKWTNEKVDAGVLETLVRRSQMFRYDTIWLYLFAKNGFTKGCVEAADQMGNVKLVAYRDILEEVRNGIANKTTIDINHKM